MTRIFKGITVGWFIGIVISIFFSFLAKDGRYHPVSSFSYMGEIYEKHLNALQVFVIALLIWATIGIMFAFAGMIFSHTDMNITQATITHFLVILVLFFPMAILAGWFPLKIYNLLSFVIIFLAVYFIIWFIARSKNQKTIDDINNKLHNLK
ncbi:DUF3021 domain-containing protein [Staphylococcus succinus]|nr:DUF3021 domain-containing protein [Staphylococcus succinus]